MAAKGVVSHVGSALLRLLGDRVGLTAALSQALAVRGFHPDIDRGRLLTDLAVAVADGAAAIDDIRAVSNTVPAVEFADEQPDMVAWMQSVATRHQPIDTELAPVLVPVAFAGRVSDNEKQDPTRRSPVSLAAPVERCRTAS